MTDIGAVLEVVNAVKGIKKVGDMIDGLEGRAGGNTGSNGKNGNSNSHNGHGEGMPHATRIVAGKSAQTKARLRNGSNGLNGDADFSDVYDDDGSSSRSRAQSAAKAPACYQHVMEHMEELSSLKAAVEYHARVQASRPLQMLEQAKQAFHGATSQGILRAFHGIAPEPIQPLESLVGREIEVMIAMQKQVSSAAHHSGAIVKTLAAYDEETLVEFESARKAIGALERRLSKSQKEKATLEEQLSQTPKDSTGYVQLQIAFNNTERSEKDTLNRLEQEGQRLLYTHKQDEQIRTKEAVVRAGLHELRLVNSYVTRFLCFVQRTRAADALIPQLVQTAGAIGDSYEVLRGIVDAGNATTTQAVDRLAQAIGTINYTVLPNTVRAGKRQQAILERMDRKTGFYEQAVRLLRGDNYTTDAGTGRLEQKQQTGGPVPATPIN